MENQTQTIKSLDIKAIISQIKNQETATTQKMSSKVSFPYIELYNIQKKQSSNNTKFPKVLSKIMYNLNKKIKAKEDAYFHGNSYNYKKNYHKSSFNRSKDYHSGEKRADSDLPFNSLSISCCIKIPQIIKKLPNPSIRGKYFLSDIETIGRHKQKPIFREDSFRKMQIPYINDFLSLKPKN